MKEAVYDIVDCGPRNRFVANGKLVHNSGRLVQLQNLPGSGAFGDPRGIAEMVLMLGHSATAKYYPPVMNAISATVRCAIAAPKGKVLVVADLAGIESRVLGYLSGCVKVNQIFANGKDVYTAFAVEALNKPYDEITKAERTFHKPPVLGCFAADTLVLTEEGWRPIVSIRDQQRVWDGVEFVRHEGVIPQGEKECLNQFGVRATADHEILVGDSWREWQDLDEDDMREATLSAGGRLSGISQGGTTSAGAVVGQNTKYTPAALREGGLSLVSSVPTASPRGRGLLPRTWASLRKITTDWRTDFMLFVVGVRTLLMQAFLTMADGGSGVCLAQPVRRSSISSPSLGGKMRVKRLIEKIITGITPQVTSVLSREERTPTTPALTKKSPTAGGSIPVLNSGESTPLGTATKVQSHAKCEKASRPSRSLGTKLSAKVPTYDVLNAGPRNRFMILTDKGPVLAHNCGFGLGWKGLIAYAEGFGVELSEEEARHLITVFRESYHEIPAMWYWLIDACSEVIRGQGTRTGFGVHITRNHDFMFIELPSGRKLAYFQPLIIKRAPPWEVTKVEESKARREAQIAADEETVEPQYVAKLKDTISYMGMDQYTKKWSRISTTGGKITENCLSGGTEILTSSGWKLLRDYTQGELLWDGVEWVSGGDLIDSGVQPVVDCWGVKMTADHQVLTEEGWRSAREVIDGCEESRFTWAKVRLPDGGREPPGRAREDTLARTVHLREDYHCGGCGDDAKTRPRPPELRVYAREANPAEENHTRDVQDAPIRSMALYDRPLQAFITPCVRALRSARDLRLRSVGEVFRRFLGGYERHLRPGVNPGSPGQFRGLYARELQVGDAKSSSEQHTTQCADSNALGGGDTQTSSRALRDQPDDAALPTEARLASRQTFHQGQSVEQVRVYDIANVGPRRRFTVRGEGGDVFLAHNCVQAVARDVLAVWMQRVAPRYDIILHVHDELGVVVDAAEAQTALDFLLETSREPIPWAPDLLLDAAGFTTKRYYKD